MAHIEGSRTRRVASVVLVILAAASAAVAGVALYAREEIVSTPAFVDRAADALGQPAIQRVVSREIAVQLLEPALPDIVAARPVVQTAVKLVVASQPFRAVFRLAAQHGHRLLFDRHGGNAVLDIADAGAVVTSALQTLAPKVAKRIPAKVDAVLLTLKRRGFAATTLRVADHIRLLGLVLPFAALGLFAAAVALAPRRRTAITRSGLALGCAAVVVAIGLELLRRYAAAHVVASAELSSKDVRSAVDELWGAYLDDLTTWALAFTAGGFLLAAASSSMLAPYSAAGVLRRWRTLRGTPRSARVRAGRAILAVAVGIFVAVKPTLALQIVAVGAGCLLVYFGLGELLTVTAPETRPTRRPWPITRRRALAFGGTVAAIAAGVIVAVVLTGATPSRAAANGTCDGYQQLCDRRLDEVVFAGTHNAMSAADSPGWFIANQDRDIAQQLRDGIRAFKISTHYGTEDGTGWVHTNITSAEGGPLNRVAERLVPSAREAFQRVSRALGRLGSNAGKQDIWLCHTLCELGATRMVAFFETIARFLEANPNQVIVLFNEDYVREPDLQAAFQRAGVYRYLAHLTPGQPLPTLRQLIDAHQNIVVFAQEPVSGKFDWNRYAFGDWIQDTPLGAKKPAEFSCKLYRGQAGNPLLMMNNWADIFPPRPQPNVPLLTRRFIVDRANQCSAQRGRLPNLIMTDFYDRGDVVKAVADLNGLGDQPPAPLARFQAPELR